MNGCVESLPGGATRPVLKDTFPEHGLSGHSATLRIDVEHGKGESLLAQGFSVSSGEAALASLKAAGFALPDQDAGGRARLGEPKADDARPDRAHTILELPILPLPPKPGRAQLTLPSVPVAVARASGDVITVCTSPHPITVEDPIANTPSAQPQPNPPPLPQREDWAAMRIAAIALALFIVAAAIGAYFAIRWMRRPKPKAPPPPPKPPWEIALARLGDLRTSGMLEQGKEREFVDGVSDVVREYLGARFGFVGIESTTDEIRTALSGVPLGSMSLGEVLDLLERADLVKFAGIRPPKDDCVGLASRAEAIVRNSIRVEPAPVPHLTGPTNPPGPPDFQTVDLP